MKSMNENNQRCIRDISLCAIKPDWDSSLVGIILELEHLKARTLTGSTPPYIFFQLKEIFHKLESLGSTRIEGNRTTLANIVEEMAGRDGRSHIAHDERMQEIRNVEKALRFVEENIDTGKKITKAHLYEIHKIITDGLSPPSKIEGGEGSDTPGDFRKKSVEIRQSKFCPPDYTQVNDYIEELLDFINQEAESKDFLLNTAIAHHRFACIHPFDNGNGRVVRVFTYALLIKYGFQVHNGRILNPTAIFCMDRDKYYDMLELADSGKQEDVLQWCEYVLKGLLREIKKIDKLLDHKTLRDTILTPTINNTFERKLISEAEHAVLSFMARNKDVSLRAGDVKKLLDIGSSVKVSRIIKGLKEKKLIQPIGKERGRIYTLSFINEYLLRDIIDALEQNGFTQGLSE
ncbi:MAG: Fic family protein [Candidatus Kaiserbacteria bacterium]|nr:Fic family protein [Candidatus Kaiserbacteria bacterium]